jgi:hypothetical protein
MNMSPQDSTIKMENEMLKELAMAALETAL